MLVLASNRYDRLGLSTGEKVTTAGAMILFLVVGVLIGNYTTEKSTTITTALTTATATWTQTAVQLVTTTSPPLTSTTTESVVKITTVSQTSIISQTVTRIIPSVENECNFDTACSVQSPQGLELLLSVNSTHFKQNDSIFLNVSEINALTTVNNLSSAGAWAIPGLSSGPCPIIATTTALAVFQGYFGLSNISSASPLDIWPILECPASFLFNGSSILGIFQNVTSYSFLPMSDTVNYSAYYAPESSPNSVAEGDVPLVD